MNEMSKISDVYTVDLHVGKDFLSAVENKETSVHTLVSRQMLCDMTAHIENNISYLNSKRAQSERDAQFYYDGLRYRNLNYMITGVRGSGKTTFLDYLIKSLTGEINPFDETSTEHGSRNRYSARFYIKTERKQVTCRLLCRFDPSLPDAGKCSFLMAIIASLQSKVSELERDVLLFRREGNSRMADCSDILKQLAKGVARISQGKKQFENLSEYEVAHLRAENAELEAQVRGNFRRAVDLVCALCGVDAFIISIDDADTHFAQCSVVMEDLRAYVTHPRLVVLFAGDRDLYLERVREMHFKEYDAEYHKTDIKGQEYRMDFVMHHANQYMIKQFPLENQYELRDINYLSRKMDPIRCKLHATINWKNMQHSLTCDLHDFVRSVFETVINDENADIDHYVVLFLSMPMRSIMQVLNAWALDEVWVDLLSLKKLKLEGVPVQLNVDMDERKTRRVLRNLVRYALFAVMRNEIRTSDYDCDGIDLDNERDFYPLMLRVCQNMNDLEHGYYLSGSLARNQAEQCMSLLLALASGSFMDDFRGFLTYFLLGPASVSLYSKALTQWQLTPDSSNESNLRLFKRDFSRYVYGSSWESPTRWARHANMIWCHDPSFEGWHLGILRLRCTPYVQLLNSTICNLKTERDALKKSYDDRKELIAQMRDFMKNEIELAISAEKNREYSELQAKIEAETQRVSALQEEIYAMSLGGPDFVEKYKSKQASVTERKKTIVEYKHQLSSLNSEIASAELRETQKRKEFVNLLRKLAIANNVYTQDAKKFRDRFLKSLSLSVAMSHSEGRDNSYFISLFSYLAFILKTVQVCDSLYRKKETVGGIIAELRKLLCDSFMIQSCGEPKWLISDANSAFHSTEPICAWDVYHENIFADIVEDVAGKILNWYIDIQKRQESEVVVDLSPRVMGDFWQRLFYELKQKSYCVPPVNIVTEPFASSAPTVGYQLSEVVKTCRKYFKNQKRGAVVDGQDESHMSRMCTSFIAEFTLSTYCLEACEEYADALRSVKDSASSTGGPHQ